MKASKLIKQLEAIIELHGDAVVNAYGFESSELVEVQNIFALNQDGEQVQMGDTPAFINLEPIT